MIKLVIFDYDGVLFDTKKVAFEVVNKCSQKFLNKKITEKEFAEIFKSNFYEAMKNKGVDQQTLDKIKDYAIEILSKKQLHVHSGIKSSVEKLSKTHTLAVISSNYDDIMKSNLENAGILGNFDYILGTEEGENKKHKIRKLLKETKISKSEAIFITDTVGDIKEAKKAGIKTMAVTWGFHNKKMLSEEKPDYIAEKSIRILEELV